TRTSTTRRSSASARLVPCRLRIDAGARPFYRPRVPQVRTRRRRPVPVTPAGRQLGDKLRQARTEAGLSQAQLGAPYFTRAHVSAIELGKIRPAMRSLEHMARKLGKPASYFLDDPGAARAQGERRLEMAAMAGLLTLSGAAEARRRAQKLLDEESLTVRERCQLPLYAGPALNLLRRDPDALRHLPIAPGGSKDIGDLTRLGAIYQGLGNAHRALGDHDAAASYYQRALGAAELASDLVAVHVMHNALAVLAADDGRIAAAYEHVARA